MKLKVQQGGRDTEVEVAEEAKGIDLKQAVENSLGVFVRNQKLIFKGKIINDAERLSERNIREGCRVLLLSTAAGQVTCTPALSLYLAAPFGIWLGSEAVQRPN